MKKVMFVVSLVVLVMLGACTKVGFEGNVIGNWEVTLFGTEAIMCVEEQGAVTFDAEFSSSDFTFVSGKLSYTGQVLIEVKYKGFAFTLHGTVAGNAMSGFIREGLDVAGGMVVGSWFATR